MSIPKFTIAANLNPSWSLPSLKELIKPVPNFPIEGVTFQDISELFEDHNAVGQILSENFEYYEGIPVSKVIGIDSRGFILGGLLAHNFNIPFVMSRKSGKLPKPVFSMPYALEYGSAVIEIQQKAIQQDDIVIVHDDILATGGTSHAITKLLIEKFGVKQENIYLNFLIDLTYLETPLKTQLLNDFNCFSNIKL